MGDSWGYDGVGLGSWMRERLGVGVEVDGMGWDGMSR